MININFKVLKNRFIIIGTIVSSIIYLIWRIFFTIPFGYGPLAVGCGIYLLVVEVFGQFEAAIHYYSMANIQYPQKPEIDESLFPHVDVFIATYNEPVDLLYKTVNGCVNMDYPDKSKVHIYICDDSDREEMKELAKKMNVNHLGRKNGKDAKAGNLNNALKNSKSPLVVTFDADMIPMHDFLTTCIPYFLTEEKVGFVQTPQSFYNPDLFQYNLFSEGRIPNEQDYFHRDIQVSRNKTNSVIYGGSNTVISREALVKIGGFYTKVITEDFATGMRIQSKGYRCYAVNEIHASGLSPADLKSLIKQRQRWARGCIQTGKNLNIIFRKGLDIKQKLSYMSSITYWYGGLKRLAYIMAPIMFSVFGVIVVRCTIAEVIIFWLPMYLFNNAALKKLSGNIRNTKWTNIYETILFPSLLPSVILETLGISQKKFLVTRKDGAKEDKNYQFKRAIPHAIFAVLSIMGIINCIRWTFTSGTPAYCVLIFWLIVNLYSILMALFFMLGRTLYRKNERFPAEVDCEIFFEDQYMKCKTCDISEGGAAFILNEPKYIPYDKDILVKLKTDRYNSEFKAQIVHVVQIQDKWKYAVKINEIDDYNLRQLFGVTYDRIPPLPKSLGKNNSIYDDIKVNIFKRGQKNISFNRKLARIQLNKELESKECNKVTLINFNYEFAVIRTDIFNELEKRITIPITKDITLNCILEKRLNDKRQVGNSKKIYIEKHSKKKRKIGKHSENVMRNSQIAALYRIENYEQIANNAEFEKCLLEWIEECKNKEVVKKKDKLKVKKQENLNELNELKYL